MPLSETAGRVILERFRSVVLFYWEGCTLAEIGDHLGRSAAAAGGLVRRGLESLRRCLPNPP